MVPYLILGTVLILITSAHLGLLSDPGSVLVRNLEEVQGAQPGSGDLHILGKGGVRQSRFCLALRQQ